MITGIKPCIQRLYHTMKTFKQLGIPSSVCKNLETKFNISVPTTAQQELIPTFLKGKRDLLLREATGTGKSFGVAISLASLVKSGEYKGIKSLYIAPNQELAFQVGTWIQQLTSHRSQIHILKENDFKSASHTVIGTPGQVLKSISQGDLSVQALEWLVVDEVDRALSLPKRYATVREQKIRRAHPKPTELLLDSLQKLNSQHQVLFASATFNRPLRYFLKQRNYVRDPIFLDFCNGVATNITGVKHHCLLISNDQIRNMKENKEEIREQTKNVLDFDDVDDRMVESIVTLNQVEKVVKGILFINSSTSVESIKNRLTNYHLRAKDIREYSPEDKNVLWIATEFSARGIDIPGVSHIFILGRPLSTNAYIHMAGRTGRLSPKGFNSGKVFSLVRNCGWTETKMKNMYDLLSIPVEAYENIE